MSGGICSQRSMTPQRIELRIVECLEWPLPGIKRPLYFRCRGGPRAEGILDEAD